MRLYGVQACIRGTTYTDKSGHKQDCGAVSLAMLAAIVKDTKPTCAPVAQLTAPVPNRPSTILVICSAHIGSNALDVGTMLITQGFAFAALEITGKPVYLPLQHRGGGSAAGSRAGLFGPIPIRRIQTGCCFRLCQTGVTTFAASISSIQTKGEPLHDCECNRADELHRVCRRWETPAREHRLDLLRHRYCRRTYKSENPKAPVYRLFAKSPRGKRIEIGGIWKKQNQNGSDYYALTVSTGYGKLQRQSRPLFRPGCRKSHGRHPLGLIG
ncbi:DUF736 family protein [Rhizobium beringeri]